MRHRPWPLVILAITQALAPITNVILSASLQKLSLAKYLQLFFQTKSWYEIVTFFGLFPLAGYALWAMKKWSYPVFLIVAGWTFFRNYQTWYYYPSVFSLPLLIFAYMVNLGLVSYFLIPAVRAVYFNPKLRWWEAKPRYELRLSGDLQGSFGSAKCTVVNVSEGGVFIETAQKLNKEEDVFVTFSFYALNFHSKAKVVHQARPETNGYGVQFTDMDDFALRNVRRMVKALQLLGVQERSGRVAWYEDLSQWATKLFTTGKGLLPDVPKHQIKADPEKKSA